MNILFSHFEIKSSAAASAAGEVKLKRQNYGQRNVPHYIHMSEYVQNCYAILRKF